MQKPKLLFVTDPLCSWCWGTLTQVITTRENLSGVVDFDLIMGGLQIGPVQGLVEYDRKRLLRLWQEVADTTGQMFSGKIPAGFVYHSEIPCRAVEIARHRLGKPPWEFFHQLQTAFYQDGLDIRRSDVLSDLLQIDEREVTNLISDAYFVQITRQHFELAENLSANALPTIFLDVGSGYKLLSGGYITTDYLMAEIEHRLASSCPYSKSLGATSQSEQE
jgi:putative protein-disulfide isomerase